MKGWFTLKDLEEAPAYTVFKDLQGKVMPEKDLLPGQWCLSYIGELYSAEVDEELEKRGLDPYPWEPEKDDDRAPKGIDDLDAAMEYLAEGGALVKVPDAKESEYWRLYVVDPLPPNHEYIKNAVYSASCTVKPKESSMRKELEVAGTYPFDSRRWRKVASLTPEGAAEMLGVELTAEEKHAAEEKRLCLFLNKGYVLLDMKVATPSPLFLAFLEQLTDGEVGPKLPPGTRAVYLHDGSYSLIEVLAIS